MAASALSARVRAHPRAGRRLWLVLTVLLVPLGIWLLASPGAAVAARPASAPPGLDLQAPAPWERSVTAPTPVAPDRAAANRNEPQLTLQLNGNGELLIEASAASRLQAAEQLAALTRSELLLAAADTLREAAPLTMSWRGRDAAEAWQALLGPHASHALQCERMRCRVWLTAGPHAAAPAANSTSRMAPSPVEPAAARQAAPAPQPALPPRQAMQPDPPGLFPSD